MAGSYGKRSGGGCCSSFWSLVSCLVFIAIAVVVGVLVYIYMFGNANEIPGIEYFRDTDPFSNVNPDDANHWEISDKVGLEITVLNALEDKWQQYFKQAIYDWENGDPDALTLSTEQVSVDSECTPVEGVIKVCNGDYGETGWRGLNTIEFQNGYIINSIARMNEFYFQAESDYEYMQFTMCHEIGHGFGLNHTDENFSNLNLGNCMDYTDRPQSNEHPDYTNYNVLAKLYGTVPGGKPSTAATAGNAGNGNVGGNTNTTGTRKRLRDAGSPRSTRSTPSWVRTAVRDLENMINQADPAPGARRLYSGTHAETLEYDLGEGYAVRFYVLR